MLNTRQKNILGLIIIFILTPFFAFANAGSPMMWFGIFHILILNVIIGLVESFILKKYKIIHSTWKIILANYASMLVGLFIIAPFFSMIFGNSDFWGGKTGYGDYKMIGFIFGMFFSYLATLIIEYPFFYLALKDKNHIENFEKAFFIANTVTNVIMFIFYFLINIGGGRW